MTTGTPRHPRGVALGSAPSTRAPNHGRWRLTTMTYSLLLLDAAIILTPFLGGAVAVWIVDCIDE